MVHAVIPHGQQHQPLKQQGRHLHGQQDHEYLFQQQRQFHMFFEEVLHPLIGEQALQLLHLLLDLARQALIRQQDIQQRLRDAPTHKIQQICSIQPRSYSLHHHLLEFLLDWPQCLEVLLVLFVPDDLPNIDTDDIEVGQEVRKALDGLQIQHILQHQPADDVLLPIGGPDGGVEVDPIMDDVDEPLLLLGEVYLIIDVGSHQRDVQRRMRKATLKLGTHPIQVFMEHRPLDQHAMAVEMQEGLLRGLGLLQQVKLVHG